PQHKLTLTARYFLIQEHALGCVLTLSTTSEQSLPITCYLIHQHTHNPYTSRLWEHGLYAIKGPDECCAMLGIASEGDVLARGVSQDQAYQRWEDGIEEIALADAEHAKDDEKFWQQAPQLSGDWPESWQRGWVYDLETLRMVIRPSVGIINHPFDGMQIQ